MEPNLDDNPAQTTQKRPEGSIQQHIPSTKRMWEGPQLVGGRGPGAVDEDDVRGTTVGWLGRKKWAQTRK